MKVVKLILLVTMCFCTSVAAEAESGKIVYATKNIAAGQTICDTDLAEGELRPEEIPKKALQKKVDAVGRISGGIACGQILVPRQCLFGNNAGYWISIAGETPSRDLVKNTDIPAGKTGVIDLKGKIVLAHEYVEIHYAPQTKTFWATDLKHQMSEKERGPIEKRLGKTILGDRWQLFDYLGNKQISELPITSEYIDWPRESSTPIDKSTQLAVRISGFTGLFDGKGKQLIAPKYQDIFEFKNNLYCGIKKEGASDEVGKLPKIHWDILEGDKLLGTFPNGTDYPYLMQSDGNIFFGFWNPSKDQKNWRNPWLAGVVDKHAKVLVRPNSILVGPFSEGLARALNHARTRSGFVNSKLKFVIPPIYEKTHGGFDNEFRHGIAFVERPTKKGYGGLYGAIDKLGRTVIPFTYEDLRWLSDDLIAARMKNKTLILDSRFKITKSIPTRGYVSYLSENVLAENSSENNMRLLNDEGKVFGPRCCRIWSFQSGMAVAQNEIEKYGVIDNKGNWVLKPVYEHLERCGKDRFIARIK